MKGGCIEGLDWKSARHIWCKRAMVPIPEGVERDDEEPEEDCVPDNANQSARGGVECLRGNGGSNSDEERRMETRKGKEREIPGTTLDATSREQHIESAARSLTSREMENTAGRSLTSRQVRSSEGSFLGDELDAGSKNWNTRDNHLTSIREKERERRRENDRRLERERVQQWERGVNNELHKIEMEKRVDRQQRELDDLRALQVKKSSTSGSAGSLNHESSDGDLGGRRTFDTEDIARIEGLERDRE